MIPPAIKCQGLCRSQINEQTEEVCVKCHAAKSSAQPNGSCKTFYPHNHTSLNQDPDYSSALRLERPPEPSPAALCTSLDLDLLSGVLCLEHQECALRHLLHSPHAPQDVLQLIKTAGDALEPSLRERRSDRERVRRYYSAQAPPLPSIGLALKLLPSAPPPPSSHLKLGLEAGHLHAPLVCAQHCHHIVHSDRSASSCTRTCTS